MKICQPHWDLLKSAIDERGLMHLVSNSGQVAAEKIQGQLSGQPEKETYDPLLAANFAIWSNAIEMGGLYLIGDGNQYCPICESESHGSHNAEWWIKNAADEQLNRARELRLVPLIQ